MTEKPDVRDTLLLLLMSIAAVLVHGYYSGVEDVETYMPGVKHVLNPALYPYNTAFYTSHAHMTLYPHLIAWSVRLTHLPLDWVMLIWHLATIFLLLLGCWHVGRLVFRDRLATWGGVALVASLLTLPVAGTALYLMDQYVSTRSFSTPASLFVLFNCIERRYLRAALWAVFTAALHPLMVLFTLSYVVVWLGIGYLERIPVRNYREQAAAVAMALLPLGLFPPVTDAYLQALKTRQYFFLLHWRWYEWLGIIGAMAVLAWFRVIGRRYDLALLGQLCYTFIVYQFLFFLAALAVSVPRCTLNLAELQPLRSLHLLYLLMFFFGGGLLARFALKKHVWRWALVFVPLCSGMCYAQLELFPSTPHIEGPWAVRANPWSRAFVWIRQNTPVDAYFALDPNYRNLPEADWHGFRALSERSMLADSGTDSGVVSMFPKLAETWQAQVNARARWKTFELADFQRLKQTYGVDWVVLDSRIVAGLECPYRDGHISVCRVP